MYFISMFVCFSMFAMTLRDVSFAFYTNKYVENQPKKTKILQIKYLLSFYKLFTFCHITILFPTNSSSLLERILNFQIYYFSLTSYLFFFLFCWLHFFHTFHKLHLIFFHNNNKFVSTYLDFHLHTISFSVFFIPFKCRILSIFIQF